MVRKPQAKHFGPALMSQREQANWDQLNARITAFESKIDRRWRLIDTARQGLALHYFSIAIGVAVVHFLTALDLLFGGGAPSLLTTPLAFLSKIVDRLPQLIFANHAQFIAVILIVAAAMAIVPFLLPTIGRWGFMLLLAPQQILLLSHLISIQTALFTGHYADGYAPNGGAYFIFADQIWLLLVIAFHSLEYVETNKIRVIAELLPVPPTAQ